MRNKSFIGANWIAGYCMAGCLSAFVFTLTGCFTDNPPSQTTTAHISGYSYIPIDPLAVNLPNSIKSVSGSNLFKTLPDNAVRVSFAEKDQSGNLNYGSSGLSVSNGDYRIVVDYINADTAILSVRIRRTVLCRTNGEDTFVKVVPVDVSPNSLPRGYITNSDFYNVTVVRTNGLNTNQTTDNNRFSNAGSNVANESVLLDETSHSFFNSPTTTLSNSQDTLRRQYDEALYQGKQYNIPIYVGVGLRVTADFRTLQANLNISGLGVASGGAQGNAVSGTLALQTLGVNGKGIAAALPSFPLKLDENAVENAVNALGTIKAALYDPDTYVYPRIVGLYLPLRGNQQLVNSIIAQMSDDTIIWPRSFQAIFALSNNAPMGVTVTSNVTSASPPNHSP